MGKQHCINRTAANSFIKGLKKQSKYHTFMNTNIKKKRNKDGSYLVTWKVYTR